MFLCCWLALVTFTQSASSTNPGVKVKLTATGLEYGEVCSTRYLSVTKHRSPETHHQTLLPFVRQTARDGFHPGETQDHHSPRYVGDTESVSHWKGPVQLVSVRLFILHSCKLCWEPWGTKDVFTSILFLPECTL